MTVSVISAAPIDGQIPGTSGLRKKTAVFMRPGYLENFVQSIFDAIGGAEGKTFVVGGDGRFFNAEAIQIILKMAAANGAAKVIVAQNGILSTPAASHLIRLNKADGGLILSASHNPGGINEDFGLKYNTANGGPAPESVANEITRCTTAISEFRIEQSADIDLSAIATLSLGDMQISIVDPVSDYQDLMQSIFDFDKIRALFASGFSICFDAMHAVTGPYAHTVLEDVLGAKPGSVVNGVPLPDFGGGHPDPNPVWAKQLMDVMMGEDAPDFGAASDGDGDRNMIVGRGAYVTPSDSLAVLTANATLVPAYAQGLAGVARSMPTSAACDRVADKLGIESFVTPTGWKFFGNLMDAGRTTLCGEESAGTGSNHVREKDGLWAVLMWLNIIAERRLSVAEIMADHWANYGRNFYSRLDFEAVNAMAANDLVSMLRDSAGALTGQQFAGLTVTKAQDYAYTDPIDHSVSEHQGIQIWFDGGARAVLRLSGTGTEGATLRIYLEQYVPDVADHGRETQSALNAVRLAILEIAEVEKRLGRTEPDVTT
ncbi:MAG: alpha-D-glucose phosphate-specific phosphoglucomutase [Rhodobacteraceae bacterium]|nr:alpha-D-glucose phosphate-specific phosphoglucomutase [Paracoccaceae bacterium]